MIKNPKTLAVAAAVSAVLVMLSGTSPASASGRTGGVPSSATPDDGDQQSRAFMTQYGVDPQTQDDLLQGLAAGILPLSDTPDASPVRSIDTIEPGFIVTINHFADGSVSVLRRETPSDTVEEGHPQARGISGCSISSGSGYQTYTNCIVDYQSTSFRFGFKANFTIVQGSYNDYISSVHSWYLSYAILHTYVSHTLQIDKKNESSSGPALASLVILFETTGGFLSISRATYLSVGSNSYWQS